MLNLGEKHQDGEKRRENGIMQRDQSDEGNWYDGPQDDQHATPENFRLVTADTLAPDGNRPGNPQDRGQNELLSTSAQKKRHVQQLLGSRFDVQCAGQKLVRSRKE